MRQRTMHRTGVLIVIAAILSGIAATATAPAVGAIVPTCAGKAPTLVGTNRGEVLEGTNKRDVIVAQGGRDVIQGKGGGDIICAGEGDDTVIGAKGADKLYGGPGDDKLRGGAGMDTCVQGPGAGSIQKCELPKPVTLESICLDEGGTYSEQDNGFLLSKICAVPHLTSDIEFMAFRDFYGARCFMEDPFALITSFIERTVNCAFSIA